MHWGHFLIGFIFGVMCSAVVIAWYYYKLTMSGKLTIGPRTVDSEKNNTEKT